MQRRFQTISRLAAATILSAVATSAAFAQGTPQSITERRTDVVQTGTGFRASKLTGAAVYNREKDKIGTIDDLILSPSNHNAFAILSVGGFLGLGKHYVAVPFSELQITSKEVTMPAATKSSLEGLPEFKYAPD